MSGVDVAGLALGALGTLQQAIGLAQEVHDMCKKYKTNPHTLQTLVHNYEDFRGKVKAVELQFKRLSTHLNPTNIAVIHGHLDEMEKLFTNATTTLNDTKKRLTKRSRINKILSLLHSVSIASECDNLDGDLKTANIQLGSINIVMVTVEDSIRRATVDESANIQRNPSRPFHRYSGDRAPGRRNSDPRNVVDSWKETFIVPPNPSDIVLNFKAKDSRGLPATPEADVKTLLLERMSSLPQTVAMTGMTGVGKSCVLRALHHDEDIIEHFKDGIYFLSLGMESDKDAIVKQAIDLVRGTGGNATALAMQRFPKVDFVMKKARDWFQGKTWLLLVDDVCDGNGIGRETLSKLMHVLAAGRGSAIVFTTRDAQIAMQGRNHVWFRPKDPPLGQDARRILLSCAKFSEEQVKDNTCEEAIQYLLRKCDGLPVALAIVGRIVSLQANTLIEEQRSKAWTLALTKFHDSALIQDGGEAYPDLSHTFAADYPELSHTFAAALRALEEEDNSRRSSFKPNRTYKEIHRALSVLRQQEWIPLSILRILWGLDTVDQAGEVARTLAKVHLVFRHICRVNDEEVEGIILHDLIHMFALNEAGNENKALHNDLLNRISSFYGKRTDNARGCRQWWRFLPDDGYIFGNLSWHLIHAGKCDELLNLLHCPEWIVAQVRVGGYLQFESDFTRLSKHINENPGAIMGDPDTIENSMKTLQTIVEAVMLSSTYVFSNPSEIWFQLHARLSKLAATNDTIARFLAYAENGAEVPWIKPVNDCLAAAGGALKWLITHRAPIRCMDTLPDADKLVCGCHDGSIVILNTRGGSAVREWPAHKGRVTSVVTADKGTKVVSCSGNNPIRVWNAATGALAFDPVWVSDPATVLTLSPDDRTVLSAGKNNSVSIWDVESCKHVRKQQTPHNGGINALTVTPCKKYVVSGGVDGTVQIWDINTGSATKPAMKGHTDEVLSIAVSNDGEIAVSGSKDGTARIWKIRSLTPEGPTLNIGMDVTCVAITKDAQGKTFVITGSSDTQVRLWRLAKQKVNPILLRGHSAEINDLTLSSSGDHVVSCSNDGFTGKIRAWNIEAAKNVGSSVAGHSLSVKSLAATPDGEHVVSGSGDKTIRIWNIRSGKQVWSTLEGHTNWVSGVAVTADGSRVVSVSYDRTIRIWDLKLGTQIREPLRGHEGAIRCLALLPKEPTLVTSSDMDNKIWVWDISDKRKGCRHLVGHTGSVLCVYVSADSERIISRSDDETIRVWDIKSMKCIRTIPNQVCFPLSKKEVMCIAKEIDDSGDEGVVGLRCHGTQIVRDYGMNMEVFEPNGEVLATMEADISSWVMVGNTLCVGTENGQVAFLQVQT